MACAFLNVITCVENAVETHKHNIILSQKTQDDGAAGEIFGNVGWFPVAPRVPGASRTLKNVKNVKQMSKYLISWWTLSPRVISG